MIDMCSFVRMAFLLGLGALGASSAVPQGRGALPVLDRLEAGQWELRTPSNSRIAAICLGDPGQLVQPRHQGTDCPRTLIGSDDRSVTVRYSCPGTGSGRTVVRVETPRLAQIDSQGLDRGIPFAVRAEARRIGACN
ncbi:hypothetical protein RCO27_04490 [Sphingosinicella sp. LHD-64]|uniref:DUF3617 domain-containing protein n=1 Tax=Sphingosinicella sp. LHD-64 TaxID=3072139 RepID=UPI00281012A4|nr:hypothetical protein [Sphingosinicella sp. LHD-64]MDQ8755480.1 hypothetical protein [Sphingosinicella sp. LHD-64]